MSASRIIPDSEKRVGNATIAIEEYDDYHTEVKYSLHILRDGQEWHEAQRIGSVRFIMEAQLLIAAFVAGYEEARRSA